MNLPSPVDAHMAERAAHGVEEHQIARLQVLFLDGGGGGGLFVGATGQGQTGCLLVDGTDKAAAIEAGVFRGAARR
jgi:6-phosphogluconate dehydrogenase (decarboxylating)